MSGISPEQGKLLIRIARQAIESAFSKEKIEIPEVPFLSEKRGIFVTLKESGELRGCIGYPEPVFELKKAIVDSAKSAAFKDPRFLPVEKSELSNITIEVSVLTEPELIEAETPEEYPSKIEIGKHGLIIRSTYYSGLLLPQVFSEHGCSPEEALSMTCRKAGLYEEAWQEEDTLIFRFEASIISEESPGGMIAIR